MTRRAVFGRGLIEQHQFAFHRALVLVAAIATHVAVRALQRELRALVVVKQRGLPLGRIVAFRACGDPILLKLMSVNVLVAIFTFGRSCLEVHVHQLGLKVGRLVAINAGGRPVRAQQRERGFCVVEAGQFVPRFGQVTSLASCRLSVGSHLLHALCELPLVRILVTTRAGQIIPTIQRNRLWPQVRGAGLVTVAARNRDVAARQQEMSFFVPRQ